MNQGQPADEHRRQPQPTIKTTGTTFFKLLPRTSTYPHPPTKSTAKAKKVGKRLIGVIFQRRRSHQAPDAAHPSPCHIAVLPDRETDDFNLPHHPTKSTPKIKRQRGKRPIRSAKAAASRSGAVLTPPPRRGKTEAPQTHSTLSFKIVVSKLPASSYCKRAERKQG